MDESAYFMEYVRLEMNRDPETAVNRWAAAFHQAKTAFRYTVLAAAQESEFYVLEIRLLWLIMARRALYENVARREGSRR